MNGVGIVENALSVGNSDTTFNRFEVDVAAFVQTDEYFEPAELNRSAKMIWNDVDVEAPRLEIYVQPKMLRHLVELYVSKRIDTVVMSMKIAVTRQPVGGVRPVRTCRCLIGTGGFISGEPNASCCRCRLPWLMSTRAGGPSPYVGMALRRTPQTPVKLIPLRSV